MVLCEDMTFPNGDTSAGRKVTETCAPAAQAYKSQHLPFKKQDQHFSWKKVDSGAGFIF